MPAMQHQNAPAFSNRVWLLFLLYELAQYSKNKEYIHLAENAIRAVSAPTVIAAEGRIIGELAVALETITAGYVEFTVVGNNSQTEAQILFESGRNYYEPRKILHYEKPGRYPDLGRPSMFICSANACSSPIFETKDISIQARKFLSDAIVTLKTDKTHSLN